MRFAKIGCLPTSLFFVIGSVTESGRGHIRRSLSNGLDRSRIVKKPPFASQLPNSEASRPHLWMHKEFKMPPELSEKLRRSQSEALKNPAPHGKTLDEMLGRLPAGPLDEK